MSRRAHPTRAIVFDFDGTLVDSLPLVLRAIAHALEPFGPRPTMDIFAQLGGPPSRFLPALLDDPRNAPAAAGRMEEFHARNQHLIRPFTGVGQALGQLRAGGVKLALWTGRDRASGEALLREHELEKHFSTAIYGDDLATHKPDPEGLRDILRRLDVTACETIMVGDADVDVLGAAACGVDALLVRHARVVPEAVCAQSWQIVGSPGEALALLLTQLG